MARVRIDSALGSMSVISFRQDGAASFTARIACPFENSLWPSDEGLIAACRAAYPALVAYQRVTVFAGNPLRKYLDFSEKT